MNEAKPWWESKTIWLNVLLAAIAVLATVDPATFPPEVQHVVITVVAVAGVLNRIITKVPIK